MMVTKKVMKTVKLVKMKEVFDDFYEEDVYSLGLVHTYSTNCGQMMANFTHNLFSTYSNNTHIL